MVLVAALLGPANGRIYAGVHYRNSTVVGNAMGKQIGALAASKLPRK